MQVDLQLEEEAIRELELQPHPAVVVVVVHVLVLLGLVVLTVVSVLYPSVPPHIGAGKLV